jgi:predicted ATPase/DNA-binding XRE family transcriptional regulator
MSDVESFGKWLQQRRKARDLSQEQLAEQIGVSPETIRKIERGTRRPSKEVAELLARALGVPENEWPEVVRFARLGDLGHDIGDVLSNAPTLGPRLHDRPRPRSVLPSYPNTFVGREREIEQARELLLAESVRLLTLTGPAGTGKTRLGVNVCNSLLNEFEDGVYFVGLAPLNDPAKVVPAICKVLGVKEVSTQPLLDSLIAYLRDKEILLFLDNFEQVVSAGVAIGELLSSCAGLKVLVTSRAVLHVYGEQEFPVPPLALPSPEAQVEAQAKELAGVGVLGQFGQYEAIDLFTQRTRAVVPQFELTEENASIVVGICRRLDALPLAIELAAARSKLLPPRALLTRLDQSLKVLTAGMQDLPPRQRTLRGAIAWSYDLLDEDEKALYRRMSVFVGTATLDAIERILDENGIPNPGLALEQSQRSKIKNREVLDLVQSLLDKSLVRQDERSGEPKFLMLWTLREYGQERLEESGEAQATRRRHATYFLKMAEEAAPHLTSAGRGPWLNRLEAEHNNLRAALEWCLSEQGDKEIGLRLAGALHWFWYYKGYLTEGREWLEKALALAGPLRRTAEGANALYAAGKLAYQQNDYAVMQSRLEESIASWRELGNERGLAHSLTILGVATTFLLRKAGQSGLDMVEEAVSLFRRLGDRWSLAFALEHLGDGVLYVLGSDLEAVRYKEESLAVYRELGDQWGIAYELREIGMFATWVGDYTEALHKLEEALALGRDIGDRWELATVFRGLGDVALFQGDLATANSMYDESLAIYRELGDRLYISNTLRVIGHLALQLGAYDKAQTVYRQSLDLVYKLGNKPNIALTLIGLAGVAEARGDPERAAILLGAAEAIREASHGMMPPADRITYERNLAAVRARLDEETISKAWDEGRAMTVDDAVAFGILDTN